MNTTHQTTSSEDFVMSPNNTIVPNPTTKARTTTLPNETSTNPTSAVSNLSSEATTTPENNHESTTQNYTVTNTQPNSNTESTSSHSTRKITDTKIHSTEGTSGLETSILTTVAPTHSPTINQSTTNLIPADTCYNIVSGVSGGAMLLLLVISMICCLRLRHKWRTKLASERERTDIWSMATYNNTIINDNFMDYQLASPRTFPPKSSSKNRRKSSGYSEHSAHIVDPFSRRSSRNNCFEYVDFRKDNFGKRGSSDQQSNYDDSTLRRNTYSAPSGLDKPGAPVAAHRHIDQVPSNRERALTFSAGKKHKVDKHVLLTHEEYIEDDKIQEYYSSLPSSSSFTTEL